LFSQLLSSIDVELQLMSEVVYFILHTGSYLYKIRAYLIVLY